MLDNKGLVSDFRYFD